MKTNAINGMAYHFEPSYTNDTREDIIIDSALENIIPACEVHFFVSNPEINGGAMPTAAELHDMQNIEDVTAAYASDLAFSITGMDFKSSYDRSNNRRTIKKFPIDATEYESAVGGTLTWAAIKITADNAITGDSLLFVDGITGWAEDNTVILVDDKVVSTGDGSKTIVKDITVTIRDVFEVIV